MATWSTRAHGSGAGTPAPTLLELERAVLAQRRAQIGAQIGVPADPAAAANPAPAAQAEPAVGTGPAPAAPASQPSQPSQTPKTWYRALALSGGGIRSATFALGVLQAIARDRNPAASALPPDQPDTAFARSRLSCFDYLSTVSGGGYVGAFLCSLFLPNRLRSHDGLTRAQRAAAAHAGVPAMLAQAWSGAMAQVRAKAASHAADHRQSPDEAEAEAKAPAAATQAAHAARAPHPAAHAAHAAPPPDLTQRLKAAADAVNVLSAGPPQRIRSRRDYTEADAVLGAPLAWLRENGRYLIPTGAGDAFYAAALGIRNWLALHYVIGTVLMAAVALVGLGRAEVATAWPAVAQAWEEGALQAAAQAFGALGDASCRGDHPPDSCGIGITLVWWSPLLPLALAPIVLVGVPLGVAFWLVHERDDGRSLPINVAMLCTLGIGLVLLGLVWLLWSDFLAGLLPDTLGRLLPPAPPDPVPDVLRRLLPDALAGQLPAIVPAAAPAAAVDPATAAAASGLAMDRRGMTLGVAAMAIFAAVLSFAVALVNRDATMQRVLLTRRLADVLVVTAVTAAIGLVDTLGQTLYLLLTAMDSGRAPALVPAGLAVGISWAARWFSAHDGQKERPAWLKKMPLTTLAGAAGVLVFLLIGGIWSLFVHWIVWNGAVPTTAELHSGAQRATLVWVLLVILLLALVAGHFAAFINLSSLQSFYGSRLTRAYLGASNGERFENGPGTLSAAEPLKDDQLAMDHYFDAKKQSAKTLAPLHIINITVNKTVDPAEQLVQRDRKGQPMAVLPMGFSIDEQAQVGFPKPSFVNGVRRPLPVGQWIGTSGAAFSTGIGRETSLGMSLLMGAANVRLGTWWESGLHAGVPGSMSGHNPVILLRHALGAVFRTQTYLSYELRARFLGTQRRWQYLSDGGHFENTGLYELLRPERHVAQIFCCDAGADPQYQFDDLANLIRLARIDLRVEITVQTEFNGPLAGVFGAPRDFKPGRGGAAGQEDAATATAPVAVPAPAPAPARATAGGTGVPARPPAAAAVPGPAAGPATSATAAPAGTTGGPPPPPASPPCATSAPTPCALLLWAHRVDHPERPTTQIVVIKPRVTRDVPVDICQYADRQPDFPQQTTADQFFDEAQWESYRALGHHLGSKVFEPEVMKELDRLGRERVGVGGWSCL